MGKESCNRPATKPEVSLFERRPQNQIHHSSLPGIASPGGDHSAQHWSTLMQIESGRAAAVDCLCRWCFVESATAHLRRRRRRGRAVASARLPNSFALGARVALAIRDRIRMSTYGKRLSGHESDFLPWSTGIRRESDHWHDSKGTHSQSSLCIFEDTLCLL